MYQYVVGYDNEFGHISEYFMVDEMIDEFTYIKGSIVTDKKHLKIMDFFNIKFGTANCPYNLPWGNYLTFKNANIPYIHLEETI